MRGAVVAGGSLGGVGGMERTAQKLPASPANPCGADPPALQRPVVLMPPNCVAFVRVHLHSGTILGACSPPHSAPEMPNNSRKKGWASPPTYPLCMTSQPSSQSVEEAPPLSNVPPWRTYSFAQSAPIGGFHFRFLILKRPESAACSIPKSCSSPGLPSDNCPNASTCGTGSPTWRRTALGRKRASAADVDIRGNEIYVYLRDPTVQEGEESQSRG